MIYAGVNIIGEFSPKKTCENQLPSLCDRIQRLIFWCIMRVKCISLKRKVSNEQVKSVLVLGFICSVFYRYFGVGLKFVVFVKSEIM